MKNLIKIIITSACIALLILQPNCVNQKTNDTQALPASSFSSSSYGDKSKTEMFISAELVVLTNHNRPKKRRPVYLYC